MFKRLLQNDVLANLAFMLVLIIGFLSYSNLPRQQDPEINFNWIQVVTVMPGASALDIERRVTSPLEDAIKGVADIRFVISQSRDNLSTVLIRFNELEYVEFNKRMADLRREIQNKEAQLPSSAETPNVFEITTSNGFPTAMVLVTGEAMDENLRRYANRVKDDITRFPEVDRINATGTSDPELQVNLHRDQLANYRLNPSDVSQQIQSQFQDISAGAIDVGAENWLVRLTGIHNDPQRMSNSLIQTYQGEVPLGTLADVQRGREEPAQLVTYQGKPAVLLSINKTPNVNTLTLVEKVKGYIGDQNTFSQQTGVKLVLVDDQTQITRSALNVMQGNALFGLVMVLVVTFLFLGLKISLLTSIAIPFVLAGVFWIIEAQAGTLNVMVLLGVVISLGMLVDDAVVVVESIYYRLERGADAVTAAVEGLKEVAAPVTASVLTTIAAFLPLMLLPGIIGQFMQVVPFVVTIALLLSLVEAYWMLPAHIIGFKVKLNHDSRLQKKRSKLLRSIRLRYSRMLLAVLRSPLRILFLCLMVIGSAGGLIGSGAIKANFFASDNLRLFYINIEMPAGTTLEKTLSVTEQVEQMVHAKVNPDEVRSVLSIAGQQLTETSPLMGTVFGQVTVSLLPKTREMASVDEIVERLEDDVYQLVEPVNTSFLRIAGGPPTTSPVEVKIQGNDFDVIGRAAAEMKADMAKIPGLRDIRTDDASGQKVLELQLDENAILKAGLTTSTVRGSISLMVDGQIIAAFQDQGEEVLLRVKTKQSDLISVNELLAQRLVTPSGTLVPLSELLDARYIESPSQIVHYNFLRTVTLFADIDTEVTNTQKANADVVELWQTKAVKYPSLQLDQSGLLDDLNESLNKIVSLFLFGMLLMYLIIATQFRSYFQPLLVLFTVLLAFIGVVFGLAVSQQPFSLYTMYGGVALAGISVNSAIVMVSAANDRRRIGMSRLHAIFYAGRRRVIPILITSLTTIAGLSSLALGLGGKSALWGPIATVIVWGLAFSTCLTLFIIPGLYLAFERLKERRSDKKARKQALKAARSTA